MAREEVEGLNQHYLQISPIIYDCIPKSCPPIGLYHYSEELGQVRLLHPAEERVPLPKRENITSCCVEGRLFLSRNDYTAFAQLVSKNLGILLDEPCLPPNDIAGIFFGAFRQRIAEFFCQPIISLLEPIRNDITVLCEYLWSYPERAHTLLAPLDNDCSRASHAARTCFVGAAIYTQITQGKLEKEFTGNLMVGLLLHDVGMSSVPDFITKKPAKLLYKERQRVSMHIESGLATLDRLRFKPPEVVQCVAEHHERFGGKGYPKGLRSDQISLPGRICAVADAFSAMISERPYASRMSQRCAIATMAADPGAFDSRIVKTLVMLNSMQEDG